MSKITVTYRSTGQIGEYPGDKETIELSVEIDNIDDYPDTLELLRTKVLEKLNLKDKHEELVTDYQQTRKKFIKVTEQLESAYKQWELVSNFLKIQGLKQNTAEFPTEALTNLTKSLPTSESGYPS